MSAPAAPLLRVDDLNVRFAARRGLFQRGGNADVKAVDGVSFDVMAGETFSVVGESGCGKTTTARAILGVQKPTSGAVLWRGRDIAGLDAAGRRAFRAGVQAVFQDPNASMNPRLRVADFIAEPLLLNVDLSAAERRDRARVALEQVGLRADDLRGFPHEFSGGQRQRIAIARAIASSPELIVLDEPVSSLDVSIRAQIMNLLKALRDERGYSYVFIAHHLGTVRYMSQMVGVMYLGRLMELAESEELFERPSHPYTRALFSAALPDHPDDTREEVLLKDDSVAAPRVEQGCRLRARCPFAMPVCGEIEPPGKEIAPRHFAACHLN